jgi:hypothetical protein
MESPKALEKERPIITQDVKVQREEANVTWAQVRSMASRERL